MDLLARRVQMNKSIYLQLWEYSINHILIILQTEWRIQSNVEICCLCNKSNKHAAADCQIVKKSDPR